MNSVLDSSAVLAYLQGESGADVVEAALDAGAVIGAANWSEVAQKVSARQADWELSRGLLDSYGLVVEPVTKPDGELAAKLWRRSGNLSLGDRLCLALGQRLGLEVLTADQAWAAEPSVRLIR